VYPPVVDAVRVIGMNRGATTITGPGRTTRRLFLLRCCCCAISMTMHHGVAFCSSHSSSSSLEIWNATWGMSSALKGVAMPQVGVPLMSSSLRLANQLGVQPKSATFDEARRVFDLYLPTYSWVRDTRMAREDTTVIGISAPQGAGKSTLAAILKMLLEDEAGMNCAILSIDDFYLTGEEQEALSSQCPSNPMLSCRGNAGTHDVGLGLQTLRSLRVGEKTLVPRYDKALRGGRGDRAPKDTWPLVKGKVDVVILEGWMLGFTPLEKDDPILGRYSGLSEVNELLRKEGYSELFSCPHAWVVLQVEDAKIVYHWRAQAERRMREKGGAGMSDGQIEDFIGRFMPAYYAYLPRLYNVGPWQQGASSIDILRIPIDNSRNPRTSCFPG
jgi:D-glycerate 3-kinase